MSDIRDTIFDISVQNTKLLNTDTVFTAVTNNHGDVADNSNQELTVFSWLDNIPGNIGEKTVCL